jgi:hypothetical protein
VDALTAIKNRAHLVPEGMVHEIGGIPGAAQAFRLAAYKSVERELVPRSPLASCRRRTAHYPQFHTGARSISFQPLRSSVARFDSSAAVFDAWPDEARIV